MNKLFDQDVTDLRMINVKPKNKIPYLWKLQTPVQDDNILVRLCSFRDGNTTRVPMAGDKTLVVYIMSLSPSGSAMMLKDGMGSKPIDGIKLIFDTMLGIVRRYKAEMLIFKFPEGRMKGQERVLKQIINMLAKNRSRGLLEIIESDDDVYLKVKNKQTMNAEQAKEYLQNKTYISVIQQTRLTSKELILANGNYQKPAGDIKDDETFVFKQNKEVNLSESQDSDLSVYESILERFKQSGMLLSIEHENALAEILDSELNNISTLEDIFDVLKILPEDAKQSHIAKLMFHIIEDEINKDNKELLKIYYPEFDEYESGIISEYQTTTESFDEQDDVFIDAVDSIIEDHAVKLTNTTLYKNISLSELQNLETGVIYLKGYTSCSLRPAYTEQESILLVIETDSDHVLILGGENSEIVLPRGTVLKTKVKKINNKIVCYCTIDTEYVNESIESVYKADPVYTEFSKFIRKDVKLFDVLPVLNLEFRFRP